MIARRPEAHEPKGTVMYTRILIGVDGRAGGRDALALGARLGRGAGAELIAVHVAHDARDGSALDARPYEALLHAELTTAGVRAATLVIGHHVPGHGLRLAAERTDADLLLCSSHRGRLGRVLAGDTVRTAMHGSHCAVTVARRGEHAPGAAWTIGVGFDGSAEARAALAAATDLAWATGGRIRVRAVGEPADRVLATRPGGGAWPSVDEQRLRSSEAMVARAFEAVRAFGVDAEGDVVPGFPVDGLERLSADVDLLVVGSRGYGAARRLLLGDIGDRLLHCARCPVVVVPRGTAPAHDRAPRRAA
jgi:nucleotide-binding universal stress UspA family protein